MPLKNGKLTHKERVFIKEYADTGNATYAAKEAGYAHVPQRAAQNLANPEIMAEARKLAQKRLTLEVLPLAVRRHVQLLEDPGTSGQTLNRAIELAYKYGMAGADAAEHKEPADMTPEELERARQTLLSELAARSKPVIDNDESSVFD